MKIALTGGAGFIGSHLAQGYISSGHEVVILDNLSSGKKENIPDGAKFYCVDIRKDDLQSIFKKEKFECVNHHAAQMDVRYSVLHPSEDATTNIVGGIRLLECAEQFGVANFIFSSTGGAIYGEQETFPADETHPLAPCSPYGLSKWVFERYLDYYAQKGALEPKILRYANVYGPRQNPHGEAGVIAIFVNALLQKKVPTINGDGKQTRDFVCVNDVVAANLSCLTLSGSHTFNIGTAKESDVNQIYKLISEYLPGSPAPHYGPAKPGEQRRSVISYQKAKKEIGWEPRTSLPKGIQKTVEWFEKSNGQF